MRKLFGKKKNEYERALEPTSLAPASIVKEIKFIGFYCVIILGALGSLIYVGTQGMVTEQEFVMLFVSTIILILVGLVGISANWYLTAVKKPLFDSEFGFDKNLRVRVELYMDKTNVRQLIKKGDKPRSLEDLEERMTQLIKDEPARALITGYLKKYKNDGFPQNLTYFYHPDTEVEGWDRRSSTRPLFHSHMLFHPLPVDEQFVFARGQDNWYGNIYFNHPLSESDNRKCICWVLDPFTNEPMPVCELVHSSIKYAEKDGDEEQTSLVEALSTMLSLEHGLVENLRLKAGHLESLKEERLHDVENIVAFGGDIADVDMKAYFAVMKPTKHKWLRSNWIKALVTIAAIGGIVLIVAMVLGYVNIAALWGG